MGHQALLIPRLILITQAEGRDPEAFFGAVEAGLRGGVDAVLAREPAMDSARFLAFCARLRALTRAHGARLIVHTAADVALAVDADGVHVAQAHIGQISAIRRWLGDAPMSVSASCHDAASLEQAAAQGADFALLSPVFPTASHPGRPHLGVRTFCRLAREAKIPVLALGGITPENRGRLAGFGVAVMRAILDAPDPEQAASRLCSGRKTTGLPEGSPAVGSNPTQ